MAARVETDADLAIRQCLDSHRSFALIAGAGSGKTSSLVDALQRVREREGSVLRQNGQRVACITYTKRAVEVIKTRLGFDELYAVSTLHSFLWDQLGHFQFDIREALRRDRIPGLIAKERDKDNGRNSRTALEARAKAKRYKEELDALDEVPRFDYVDANVGDYRKGRLGHDDIIAIATHLFAENETFRRITGLRFPYIFVDEAQDTVEGIVVGLNAVCSGQELPIVGYFGDPWQQIYDGSAGDFRPPESGETMTKEENFRCSVSVIKLLNAFRGDVKQYPAGDNKERNGSVIFRLVKAESPEGDRKRYTDAQVERASARLDQALSDWEWSDRPDVVRLFLVRQMIARRMGFAELNKLFTGIFASSRAEDAFQAGEHFLLLPLTSTVLPLVESAREGNSRRIVDVLRRDSPSFAADGPNADRPLKAMIETALSLVDQLAVLWNSGTIRDVLQFCVEKGIIRAPERLLIHLQREPRTEAYNDEVDALDKGDWLADEFFKLGTDEVAPYTSFISNNTVYSTQHGVKGEEYPKVLVVYDDVEASWNNYSFSKILTPDTAGVATEGQLARGKKLAYVSFSRALEDLRVLLFTSDPESAKDELLERGLLDADQIEIAM